MVGNSGNACGITSACEHCDGSYACNPGAGDYPTCEGGGDNQGQPLFYAAGEVPGACTNEEDFDYLPYAHGGACDPECATNVAANLLSGCAGIASYKSRCAGCRAYRSALEVTRPSDGAAVANRCFPCDCA